MMGSRSNPAVGLYATKTTEIHGLVSVGGLWKFYLGVCYVVDGAS